MVTINLENKTLKQYSLNFLIIRRRKETNKKNLMDNLFEYMIKDDGNKKEDLALNVDEVLYGNK
ncbi:MAG: hypothetical protein AB7E37_04570 [Candidatus Altimarinota bacterium]